MPKGGIQAARESNAEHDARMNAARVAASIPPAALSGSATVGQVRASAPGPTLDESGGHRVLDVATRVVYAGSGYVVGAASALCFVGRFS